MVTTLSLPSESPSLPNVHPPPPSQDSSMQQLAVPDVFVIPPEEEQHETPPWCYFDAAEAVKEGFSTTPDFDSLAVALDLHRHSHNGAPVFRRAFSNDSEETVVMPVKSRSMRRSEHQPREQVRTRAEEDSEIIEVVKVRRNEGKEDAAGAGSQLKKSKTFRMRATQALKSIKNVGKSGRAKGPTDPWPSQESMRSSRSEDIPAHERDVPRPDTPNMAKRKSSGAFSQFFTLSQPRSADAPTEFERPTSPAPSKSPHRGSIHSVQSLNALALPSPSSSRPQIRNCPSLEDCVDTADGRASPSPLSKRKSFRTRISVLDLHRFFSPSGSSASDMAAASSSDRPQSPEQVQDLFSLSSSQDSRGFSLDSSELSPSSSSIPSSSESSGSSVAGRMSPVGFQIELDSEMRLDSLHFDSLHFDMDDFLSD